MGDFNPDFHDMTESILNILGLMNGKTPSYPESNQSVDWTRLTSSEWDIFREFMYWKKIHGVEVENRK